MADTTLACPACKKLFRVRPEQDGHRVRCPHCQETTTVRLPEGASPVSAVPFPADGREPTDRPETTRQQVAAASTVSPGGRPSAPTIAGRNCRTSRLGKGLTIIGFAMLCLAALAVLLAVVLFLAAFSAGPSQKGLESLIVVALAQWFLYLGISLALSGLIFCGFGHNLEYLARIEKLLQEQRRF
jgi:predicted Zn finger-like uncharacterized protein